MSQRSVRFVANGIITVFTLLMILAKLTMVSLTSYVWLWGIPALFISLLDISFT